MNPELLTGLAIPLLYLLLRSIDTLCPARQFETVRHWNWIGSAFFIMVLALGAIVPLLLPLNWLASRSVLNLKELGWWGVPIGVLTVTFFAYWLHRAEHRFHWLWRMTHQLHHSARRIDMAGAYFAHPLEVILKVTMGTVVSLYLLGLAPLAASAVTVVGAFLSMWQHWNINTPHWLGYIIPRPESHVLHHERDIHARNYGDLPLWDMIFGTFVNPRAAWNGQVGFARQRSEQLVKMLMMGDVHQ